MIEGRRAGIDTDQPPCPQQIAVGAEKSERPGIVGGQAPQARRNFHRGAVVWIKYAIMFHAGRIPFVNACAYVMYLTFESDREAQLCQSGAICETVSGGLKCITLGETR